MALMPSTLRATTNLIKASYSADKAACNRSHVPTLAIGREPGLEPAGKVRRVPMPDTIGAMTDTAYIRF